MNELMKLFSQYGFNGIVTATLFFIVWRLLVWVMKWVDKQDDRHNKERETWLEIISTMKQLIDLHNQNSVENRNANAEAHKYQREEHEKMMENLGEQGKVLARINGYKT